MKTLTKRTTKRSTKKSSKTKRQYTGPVLVLKTTRAGGVPHCLGADDSKGGKITTSFVWPRTGRVECPDWNPEPKCGGGFHGLEFGEGSWGLLNEDATPSEEWRVVRVEQTDLVRLNDNDSVKVKFHAGDIIYCGNKAGALAMVMCGKEFMDRAIIQAKSPSSGHSSTSASSGDSSTSASSGDSSTSASSGDSSTSASSGDSSKSASSGDYSKSASSGDSSTSASSGYYSKSEQIGKSGIAVAIGKNVRAKAGQNGLLILTYWDTKQERYHACVGEVGRDVEADTWYNVVDGKLAKE
jgi:hypothetical protein